MMTLFSIAVKLSLSPEMDRETGICIWRSADRNKTLKYYFGKSAEAEAKVVSFSDVSLQSLEESSVWWPLLAPCAIIWFAHADADCLVDVKYCNATPEPREQWSQSCCWDWQLHCVLNSETQNQKHKWTQTECPDLSKKPDWIWCKTCLHLPP